MSLPNIPDCYQCAQDDGGRASLHPSGLCSKHAAELHDQNTRLREALERQLAWMPKDSKGAEELRRVLAKEGAPTDGIDARLCPAHGGGGSPLNCPKCKEVWGS